MNIAVLEPLLISVSRNAYSGIEPLLWSFPSDRYSCIQAGLLIVNSNRDSGGDPLLRSIRSNM